MARSLFRSRILRASAEQLCRIVESDRSHPPPKRNAADAASWAAFPSGMAPAPRSGGNPEQRRGAACFDDRVQRIVTGRGFEPARRIEHERQQVQVADRVEEDPRSGQDPMDGLFDVGRILERLVTRCCGSARWWPRGRGQST